MAPSAAELVQVITGDGRFDQPALETLMATASSSSASSSSWAAGAKNDYQVIAIMGPQSSGKSTLMNYLVSCRLQAGRRRRRARAPIVQRRPLLAHPPPRPLLTPPPPPNNTKTTPVRHLLPRDGRHVRTPADHQGRLGRPLP